MILPDVNLLIYSVDKSSPFHQPGYRWLDGVLSSTETVAFSYPAILGFIRITTNPRLFETPATVHQAVTHVSGWLGQPHAILLTPGDRHWTLLERLLISTGVGANLTTDAHLAALAIEHGFTLFSNDTDFARFSGLTWVNPFSD